MDGVDTLHDNKVKQHENNHGADAPVVHPLVKKYSESFGREIHGGMKQLPKWNSAALDLEKHPNYDEDLGKAALAAWKLHKWEAYRAKNPDSPTPDFSYFCRWETGTALLPAVFDGKELPCAIEKKPEIPPGFVLVKEQGRTFVATLKNADLLKYEPRESLRIEYLLEDGGREVESQ